MEGTMEEGITTTAHVEVVEEVTIVVTEEEAITRDMTMQDRTTTMVACDQATITDVVGDTVAKYLEQTSTIITEKKSTRMKSYQGKRLHI